MLHGISFEVEEGETAVLFGLNGAGKTTTVATIAGLLSPDSGSIRFDGQEIGGRPAAALVADGISLSPRGATRVPPPVGRPTTSAWAPGCAAATARSMDEQRRSSSTTTSRASSERHGQLAGTLSGGEQQMLAIGRALMSRPAAAAHRRGVARASAPRWPRRCSRS